MQNGAFRCICHNAAVAGAIPVVADDVFGFQRAASDGRGEKKVVPPPIGRVGAGDGVRNADLSVFLRFWGWRNKIRVLFGGLSVT